MSDLLPCPFCGGEATQTVHLEYSWFAPVCKLCGVCGPSVRIPSGSSEQTIRDKMNEADRLWNTRAAERTMLAPLQVFKDAIIDELVVCHILNKEHETNARKAVQDAITWNCQVALDPKVSSDAAALVAEAEKRGMLEAAEITDRMLLSTGLGVATAIRQAAERKTK